MRVLCVRGGKCCRLRPARSARRPSARATAAGGGSRGFGGPTAQGELLAVNASSSRVGRFAIEWYGDCDDGDTFSASTQMPSMRVKRGRFSRKRTETQDAGMGFSVTFVNSASGRITGSRARGTFRTTVVGRDPDGAELWRCDTGPVSYSAPRAYAGVTSQGGPLVLLVSSDRSRVQGLLGSQFGECASPGNMFGFTGTSELQGGEVSGGRFHATGTDRREQPQYVSDVSHELDGSLTARRSEGRWKAHADVTERASGQPFDSCDSEAGYRAVR